MRLIKVSRDVLSVKGCTRCHTIQLVAKRASLFADTWNLYYELFLETNCVLIANLLMLHARYTDAP
jgi:hypothetical protein